MHQEAITKVLIDLHQLAKEEKNNKIEKLDFEVK